MPGIGFSTRLPAASHTWLHRGLRSLSALVRLPSSATWVGPFVLSLALFVVPLAAGAQPAVTVYRVGVLGNISPTKDPASRRLDGAFVQGLRESGWVEGQNTIIEWRYSDGRPERFPDLAAELVRLKVDVIVTLAAPAARAAKQATTTIPIVAIALSDPVGQGLIASLARPGGNITGLATLFPELAAKRLALLKETLPRIARVAVLRNAANPGNVFLWREVQTAGRTLGVTLHSSEVRGPDDFQGAFATMIKDRPEGLLILDDPLFFQYRTSIVDFAAKHRLPAMHPFKESVEAGGLITYSVNLADMYRRGAVIVDKILKGAKPADLPMEQPTTFELVINLKTAKLLGLTIPPSVLARADQIIE
jgi:putative tryptophan/tyrosine transport system substrate-binding protein